jgi:hypothetical protein
MTKRDAQEITMALVAIQDARRAVAVGANAEALAALEDAAARLESVPHHAGPPSRKRLGDLRYPSRLCAPGLVVVFWRP